MLWQLQIQQLLAAKPELHYGQELKRIFLVRYATGGLLILISHHSLLPDIPFSLQQTH